MTMTAYPPRPMPAEQAARLELCLVELALVDPLEAAGEEQTEPWERAE